MKLEFGDGKILRMLEAMRKPCAGCNSTPKGSFKDTKTVKKEIFLLPPLFSISSPPPPFESLNLTKAARPVPEQTGSLEEDQKPLRGRGSP